MRPADIRFVATLLALLCAAGVACADERPQAPAWTADARWYYVFVPRFQNGDKANDPNDTLPWTVDWLAGATAADPANVKEVLRRHYGGDLQGLQQRLPYLEKLGVNALILSSVFQGTADGRGAAVDMRHIDPLVGVRGGYSETDNETADPATWIWTASDGVFLDFLKVAHQKGFRVVVGGLFGSLGDNDSKLSQMQSYAQAVARRWIDPNADGDPSDGVDGWVQGFEEVARGMRDAVEESAWLRFREGVKKLNPNLAFIGPDVRTLGQSIDKFFDVFFDASAALAIERFFHPGSPADAKALFAGLQETSTAPGVALELMGVINGPRLLTSFSEPSLLGRYAPPTPGPTPTDAAVDRWRLATIVQFLGGGTPVTYYGDEVGMYGGGSGFARAPMWWDDLSDPATQSPGYRNEFFALIEWLHRLRAKYPALSDGAFRSVLQDPEHKTLAFARTLPGDEVIVAVNYSDAKQEVRVSAGKPSQLVALISPLLKPPPTNAAKRRPGKQPPDPKHLLVGGNRQFVSSDGTITFWVDAMSARIVLINDQEPRRP